MSSILLKLKDQQLRILGYILLVVGIVILVQGVLFVFKIGNQLLVPPHLFSAPSQLYPAQFFQLLNFVAWLAVIFFVCIVGIMIIQKGIAVLKLHQDAMFAAKIDQDEIKLICKNYEQVYD